MWRPKNWKNPFEGAFEYCDESYPKGIPKGYHILQDVGYEEGYEAGADAMLGVLKKRWALRIITVRDIAIPVRFPKDTKGWLVLIPEEEE